MNTHRTRHDRLIDQFGYRLRQRLNSGTDEVSERTLQRLSAARSMALARRKSGDGDEVQARVPIIVAAGVRTSRLDWQFPRFAFLIAAFVLGVGVLGISEWQEQAQIAELADLDTAILADELPFTAHLDPNYKTLLVSAQ